MPKSLASSGDRNLSLSVASSRNHTRQKRKREEGAKEEKERQYLVQLPLMTILAAFVLILDYTREI